jgi:lipid-binding SYLF domain-containing protein
MRLLITGILLLGLAGSAGAIGKANLDKRIRTLTAKFEELQAKPDKRIPAENLRKAQGIILLDRTQAALIFAHQGGGGVATVKNGQFQVSRFTPPWSAQVAEFRAGGK